MMPCNEVMASVQVDVAGIRGLEKLLKQRPMSRTL